MFLSASSGEDEEEAGAKNEELRSPARLGLSDDVDAGSIGDETFELRGVERHGLAIIGVQQKVAGGFEDVIHGHTAAIHYALPLWERILLLTSSM